MHDLDIQPEFSRDLVIFTVRGAFDVRAALTDAIAFYDRHPVGKSLWDFSEADLSALTLEEMRDAYRDIRRDTGRPGDTRAALVFGNDAFAGLAHLYQAMVEAENTPVSYGVFKTTEQALVWLADGNPAAG